MTNKQKHAVGTAVNRPSCWLERISVGQAMGALQVLGFVELLGNDDDVEGRIIMAMWRLGAKS